LREVLDDWKALILSDSQAAIATMRKVGRTGRGGTAELKEVVQEMREE